MTRAFLLAIPALLLVGCAATGDFPSLAPRAVEGVDVAEPDAAAPVPVAADPTAGAEAARALAAAQAGEQDFAAALVAARPALARGTTAAEGSEAWIIAQEALSRVQAARRPAIDALDRLDALRVARGAAGPDPAVEAAWTRASAIDAEQARRLATLAGG